jgi:ATP-dependent protease HslVU (ClpYQ) peptidase subunit
VTICAAIAPPSGGVWIGSDTMMIDGPLALEGVPKFILHAPWALAVSGDVRVLTVMQAQKSKLLSADSPQKIIENIRALLLAEDLNPTTERGTKCWGQRFILANATAIWSICSSLSIIEDRFAAIGSGRQIAHGAEYALRNRLKNPRDILSVAIKAAIDTHLECGGRCVIHKMR